MAPSGGGYTASSVVTLQHFTNVLTPKPVVPPLVKGHTRWQHAGPTPRQRHVLSYGGEQQQLDACEGPKQPSFYLLVYSFLFSSFIALR